MNRLIILSIVFLFALVGYTTAHEGMDHNELNASAAQDKETPEASSKAIEVGNIICPVSGNKIEKGGKMGEPVKYEYQGKVYNLCCPMCLKDFKKDPEKYSKIAEEEAGKNKESSK